VFIDTLHPIYEGRLVRWGHDPSQPVVQEYGRTSLPEGVSDLRLSGREQEAVTRWRASPFFRMLQPGRLRRRVNAESEVEFSWQDLLRVDLARHQIDQFFDRISRHGSSPSA